VKFQLIQKRLFWLALVAGLMIIGAVHNVFMA
jgi:hypothetical protein